MDNTDMYDPFGGLYSTPVPEVDTKQDDLQINNLQTETTETTEQPENTATKIEDGEIILGSIINDTGLTASLSYLSETLTREDFIIYFYAREFYNRGVRKLTRRGLMAALESNAIYWLKKNSILNRRTDKEKNKIDSEYLSIATGRTLYSDADCCDALRTLVQKRYDKIAKLSQPNTEDEMMSVVEGHKLTAQIKFTEDLVYRCYNLLSGDKTKEYLNGVMYESSDLLNFVKDLSTEYLNILNGSSVGNSFDNYQTYLRQMSSSISATDVVFKWNLGEPIISDPLRGWLLTLNAPPKKGKTRFTLGEMVYPALKAGRNVDYFSGEMKLKDVMSLLVVKFLYSEFDIDFSSKVLFRRVGIALQISAKMQLGVKLTQGEENALKAMGQDFFSIVLVAQNQIVGVNSTFGKLRVISLTDDESSTTSSKVKTRTEQQFIVENLEHNIMSSIEKRPEEERPDLIVFDHAGHFSSSSGLTRTDCFSQVYSIGHKLAGNKLHPFLCVIINHTATEQGEKSRDKKSFDGANLRAFGTSEAGKSADVDLSLVSTEDQDKDGQVTLVVNVDRWNNQRTTFKTNAFNMNASKGTCEFTLVGSAKVSYPSKEEIINDNSEGEE